MKKLILVAVAVMLLSGTASGQNDTPPVTCEYAREVKQLSAYQLNKLDMAIGKTAPFSAPREVLSAQALGILQLLDVVESWEERNCRKH